MTREATIYKDCTKCGISMRIEVTQTKEICGVCEGINVPDEEEEPKKRKRQKKES